MTDSKIRVSLKSALSLKVSTEYFSILFGFVYDDLGTDLRYCRTLKRMQMSQLPKTFVIFGSSDQKTTRPLGLALAR